jgi:hypothetical protein
LDIFVLLVKLIKLSVSIGSIGGRDSGGVVGSRGRGEEGKRGICDTTCGRNYSTCTVAPNSMNINIYKVFSQYY